MNPLPMDELDLRIASNGFGRRLLFNVRTRGVLLRATIVLCVMASVLLCFWDLQYYYDWDLRYYYLIMVLPIFGGTALLQLLSAFRLKVVLGFVDVVLLLGQLGVVIFWIACWLSYFSDMVVHPTVTIGAIISTKGRNLWVPFDIQLGTPFSQRRKTLYILVGAFIWRRLFRRESNVIRILRGCFATIILAMFIFFAYTNVLSYPLSELRSGVRVKTFRMALLNDIVDQIDAPTWNIFVVVNWDPLDKTTQQGWEDAEMQECRRKSGSCVVHSQQVHCSTHSPFRWIFKVVCPPGDDSDDNPFMKSFFLYQPEYTPDLLVSVNFTSLGILSKNATGDPNSYILGRETSYSTVSVMAGLSKGTADVLTNAQAAVLLPNEHLLSGVDAHVRQRFTEAGTATLGLSSLNRVFANIFCGRPRRSKANPSLAIPRDNNTGSLYLYKQVHQTEDWTIVTDYREDSVLSGLSQVGGFWTFINGLFVFIFGSRLVMIFFGVKPLSTFGLVHSFSRVDLGDSYPRILSEGDLPEAQRGLVAFMREHMVDLGSVKGLDDVESRGERDIEMEEQMIPSSYLEEELRRRTPCPMCYRYTIAPITLSDIIGCH
ncbi:hypothetical protein BDZ89DRAFT_1130968 [Hymenopellis radicata]|nr:hypothetical protein BDZ89DRAFT_1130968 [Hymenopellis radicata]